MASRADTAFVAAVRQVNLARAAPLSSTRCVKPMPSLTRSCHRRKWLIWKMASRSNPSPLVSAPARKLTGLTRALEIHLFLACAELEEDSVRISLTIVDTPGFGDQIDNEYWCVARVHILVRAMALTASN